MRPIFIIIIIIFSFSCRKEKQPIFDKSRSHVTFIVGKDNDETNDYYSSAKQYYLTHDIDNQIVIDTCKSLISILQFLNNYPTISQKPWGTITIVSHGNEWTGLQMPLLAQSKERTNNTTLQAALDNKLLEKIEENKIDNETQLHLQSCAVGKDAALLKNLKKAFGGKASIHASKNFIVYSSDNQCFEASYFYAFQHLDSAFDEQNIIRQWRKNYPNENLNWEQIIHEKHQSNSEKPFLYSFKIPISWTLEFDNPSEIPTFSSPKDFEQWLFLQGNIMQSLSQKRLNRKDFKWRYVMQQGKIKVYGAAKVYCVLKPLQLNRIEKS